MSQTVGTVRDNVRTLMRDRSVSDSMMGSFELNYHIKVECGRLFQEIGLAPTWENGIINLVIGTFEYTITATAGLVNQIIVLRTHNRNWPLARITDDELESMQLGPSSSTPEALFFCRNEETNSKDQRMKHS